MSSLGALPAITEGSEEEPDDAALSETSDTAGSSSGAAELIMPRYVAEYGDTRSAEEILVERVTYLEDLISHRNPGRGFRSEVPAELVDVTDQLHQILASLEGVKRRKEVDLLFNRYRKLQPLLDACYAPQRSSSSPSANQPSGISQLLASTESRMEVLEASSEHLDRIGLLLGVFDELQSEVKRTPLEGIRQFDDRMDRLEAASPANFEKAIALHEQVSEAARTYYNLMFTISQLLAEWDGTLEAVEEVLDAKLRQKGKA